MKLLDMMPATTRDRLQEKHFSPGEIILHAGEDNYYLYFLQTGTAEAYMLNESGSMANIFIYEPDSVFGEMEQFWDESKLVTITALTPCTALLLHRADLFEWLQQDFAATQRLIAIMAEKLMSNAERIQQMQLLTVRERLLHCIARHLTLGDLSTLTKNQAAIETGAPVRSINRAIAECAAQGLLRYEKKTFAVLNEPAVLACLH